MSKRIDPDRLGKIARIGATYIAEQVRPPVPLTLKGTPGSADTVSAPWLTAALCADVPGARVLAVEVEPASKGSTQRSRLLLTYNEVGRAAGLPETVFVKSTTSFQSRLAVGMTGAAEGEWRFYSRIRPGADILTPEGYHGQTERTTGRTILLLEDIARTRDASFGDCTNRVVTRPMAESLVATLASVHGHVWDSPRLSGDLKWLQSSERVQKSVNKLLDFGTRSLVGFDRAADVFPGDLRAQRARVMPALMESLALDSDGPVGLVHTDVHSGNWFTTSDDQMGLYDWQALAKGLGFRDLAYALMSNLTIEDRRAWERELVELYVDLLAKAGGKTFTPEQAWTSYRQQTIHGLCYWLFTIGAGRLEPAMQKTGVSLVNLERMGQAVSDLESFAALDGH